ncbi:MAG: hypothetical protein ACR2IM_01805 [Sediminibacterium sp.]
MNTGLLHLHNILRWVILIFLLLSIYKLFVKQDALKASKILLIAAHSTLLIGLYQYFISSLLGFKMIQTVGMKTAMGDAATRFWGVEHAFTMIMVIIFITIGHIRLKKSGKPGLTKVLYLLALLLILLMTPWPFKTGVGRPWFPGI